MSTNKQAPGLLSLSTLAKVHTSHPEIGRSLQEIVDYINQNITPPQGTKIKPRNPGNGR